MQLQQLQTRWWAAILPDKILAGQAAVFEHTATHQKIHGVHDEAGACSCNMLLGNEARCSIWRHIKWSTLLCCWNLVRNHQIMLPQPKACCCEHQISMHFFSRSVRYAAGAQEVAGIKLIQGHCAAITSLQCPMMYKAAQTAAPWSIAAADEPSLL